MWRVLKTMEDKMGVIFKQYDFNVEETYRVKGCTVIKTEKGEFVIKPYEGSETKARIDNAIKIHLHENGYEYMDITQTNREGELISYNQYGNPFVIKRMYQGLECDLYNHDQVIAGVQELAKLHKILRTIVLDKELEHKIRSRDVKEDLNSYLKGIRRVNRYIVGKNKKNDFETQFLRVFPEYIYQGEEAAGILAGINFARNEKADNTRKWEDIYHGSFDQHSILFLNSNMGVTVSNFEKVAKGCQIVDLYHFIRKTMEKNEWEEELGIRMIEEYVSKIDVSGDEMKLLEVMFIFPEKFWKIVNRYYNTRKVWVSGKSLEKLNSLNEQEIKRKCFIKAIKEYRK